MFLWQDAVLTFEIILNFKFQDIPKPGEYGRMGGEAPLPKIMQSSISCCAIQSSKSKILTVFKEKNKPTNSNNNLPTWMEISV